MRQFTVTVGADNAPPIITETVNATDPNEAMLIVLDLFKFDDRVMDAKTWNVTINEGTDAQGS
jgi:protein subunit release factor A